MRLHAPLRLRRVQADSRIVGALQRAYRRSGVLFVRPVVRYPWIPLEEEWIEPEQRFNSGRRSDFRRMQRHAEKLGPVSYEVVTPLRAQLETLLEEAYRAEAASWKGACGSARILRVRISRYDRILDPDLVPARATVCVDPGVSVSSGKHRHARGGSRHECLAENRGDVQRNSMKSPLRDLFWKCWMPIASRAAGGYVVGPELEDALRVSREVCQLGFRTTVCYWNLQDDAPRQVANGYLRALDVFEREQGGWYLSIKAPALGFSSALVSEIVNRCRQAGVRAHFDAYEPETSEATFNLIREGLEAHGSECNSGPLFGCTLPGRWRRSLADAGWAIENGLSVRVVKGQWKDLDDPSHDPQRGFLEVVERLAGRARHVGIATHDPVAAARALEMLCDANTACELELLFGLPLELAMDAARRLGVPVRVYIPYGHGWLPYCLSQVQKNPRILWWLLQDLLLGKSHGLSPAPRTIR